ncbi:MAG: nitroreductase/quinone reductase family protein [Nitrosopumilaceae archaeon]
MRPQEVTFKAILITTGRKTGKEHAVELKAVFYDNKFYFSRRNSQSDWLKNSLVNPHVKIQYNDVMFSGIASLINDENLAKKISQLKYSDNRADESRVVLEVMLHEQL